MKTKQLLLIRHFLVLLKDQTERELMQSVTPSMTTLLSHMELRAVIDMLFDGEGESEYPNLANMSKEELLNIIHDEYYILDYLLTLLNEKIE